MKLRPIYDQILFENFDRLKLNKILKKFNLAKVSQSPGSEKKIKSKFSSSSRTTRGERGYSFQNVSRNLKLFDISNNEFQEILNDLEQNEFEILDSRFRTGNMFGVSEGDVFFKGY